LPFGKRILAVTQEQAEVITDLQKTTTSHILDRVQHDYHLDDIATKRDLTELEYRLEVQILKIAETKADLIRWMIGLGSVQITIFIWLMLRLTGRDHWRNQATMLLTHQPPQESQKAESK
jgi:hypothetical protein